MTRKGSATPVTEAVEIDPVDLLRVRIQRKSSEKELVAFSVAYIPAATLRGKMVMAVEVLYDPRHPRPRKRYTVESYRQLILSPESLLALRPYLTKIRR